MIRNDRALQPEFVPQDLHHREGELDVLSSCLRPLEDGAPGQNALITGPPGTGKTTLARFVLDELTTECPGVRSGVVDCWQTPTLTDSLYTLLQDLGLATFAREAASAGRCLDVLRDREDPVVVLVDEVDVAPPRLIPSLYAIEGVTMVMACVDEHSLLSDAERRVADRIRGATSLPLAPYSEDALEDIVRARADVGLAGGAVDSATVATVARRADGNARLAIALLREAARAAASESQARIRPDVVDRVADDAHAAVRALNRSRWGTQHHVLWNIVREHGEIGASELHAAYEERADHVIDRSQRRRYLASLREYGEIEADGATSNRVYRYVGA